MRTTTVAAAGIALVAVLASVITPTTADAATSATDLRARTSTQLFGAGQYRSPTSEAARAAAALAATDPAGAAAASTIARYPVATWLGEWTTGTTLTKTIAAATAGAAAANTTAVFVTYAIPDRDCGGYSSGGFDEARYDAWVDQIVRAVAGTRSAVVVEPDSLAMLSDPRCTSTLGQQRYRILAREVAAFTAAGVPAYLDAGNSNWIQPAVMAGRLEAAGVRTARGFSTNVSNYYPTAREQAYAQQVSAMTGGSHYVIDTSRNGTGWRGTWCNGPGAGLGTSPRVVADGTALDALLWVKTPGASDGTCNGGPAAGTWWSTYAQALVRAAQLGTPPTGSAPTGTFDAASSTSARRVDVTGWAFDRDDVRTTVTVTVAVDGVRTAQFPADAARPDVDRSFRAGPAHGFSARVVSPSGSHKVCVTATGLGLGGDALLGCRTVSVR